MSAASFHDLFSGHAENYARFRPTYPEALYRAVVAPLQRTELAWDCATGNGQAALCLTRYVERVIATDASPEQLEHAVSHPRVSYRHARAEASGLADASVDLITAAAAAHWFDLDAFYAEVRRVARPGAAVALWTYRPCLAATPAVDALIDAFATERLAPYWARPITQYVQTGYATLPFPFEDLPTPDLACSVEWSLDELLCHVRTWSAVQTAFRQTQHDPVNELSGPLGEAWGDPTQVRTMTFPLYVRLGRV